MGALLSYKCICDGELELDLGSGRKNKYICSSCGSCYERKRSDTKWVLRPIKSEAKKSGVIAPRAYRWGFVWSVE